jgi:hypothetical protein
MVHDAGMTVFDGPPWGGGSGGQSGGSGYPSGFSLPSSTVDQVSCELAVGCLSDALNLLARARPEEWNAPAARAFSNALAELSDLVERCLVGCQAAADEALAFKRIVQSHNCSTTGW